MTGAIIEVPSVDILVDEDLQDVDIAVEQLQKYRELLSQSLQSNETFVTYADLLKERDICVRVCSEGVSQQFNQEFRGKNKPTNILSFVSSQDLPADVQQQLPLGDLLICWPVLVAEAQAQQKSIEDHVSHLFIHGCLHLLGFDHEGEQEAMQMEAIEIEVLAQLDIANPYVSSSQPYV